jgi:GNAT superfamily N-acetyltransferase
MTHAAFTVRLAAAADAAVLARHRVEMFTAMGSVAAGGEEARAIAAATERLLPEAIDAGRWAGWIAEEDGRVLGGGCAVLRPLWPRPGHPEGGTEAYLLNFFTEPAARRRGVATAVMEACLAWCAGRGIARITLHASDAGRFVYAPLGFVPREGEMVWQARPR